jgi:sugar lactone lactonase YvrE
MTGVTSARMQFEVIASGYGLVEAPTIDPDGGVVYSDVLGGGVYRAAPDGTITTVVPKRRGVGGIALHADGGVVCSGRDVVRVHDGGTTTLASVDGVLGWNDLCADAQGRVYAGSLRFAVFDREATAVPGECRRIDGPGASTELYGGVVHANGIALSPDGGTLYHSDTRSSAIVVHTLASDGTAQDRRVIDTSTAAQPDGIAVDVDGCLWVALLEYGIGRFTPEGVLDGRVEVPSTLTTSLCFAPGSLYVTTANHTEDPNLRGCLLRAEIDVEGAPVHLARV